MNEDTNQSRSLRKSNLGRANLVHWTESAADDTHESVCRIRIGRGNRKTASVPVNQQLIC
jgi:hypothetical protein